MFLTLFTHIVIRFKFKKQNVNFYLDINFQIRQSSVKKYHKFILICCKCIQNYFDKYFFISVYSNILGRIRYFHISGAQEAPGRVLSPTGIRALLNLT